MDVNSAVMLNMVGWSNDSSVCDTLMEEAELSSSGASSFSFSDTSLAVRVKDEQESI